MKPAVNKAANSWTFAVGIHQDGQVTVRAMNYHDAVARARSTLDRRYETAGREPPASWTLILMKAYRK